MAPPKKVKISKEDLERWWGVGHAHEEMKHVRSRQGIRNMLERDELRGVKTEIGWLIDPASVRAVRLRLEDDAEREKIAHREALIREATQTHEDRV